jgi:choline dehydrogenase-like flavoprotein
MDSSVRASAARVAQTDRRIPEDRVVDNRHLNNLYVVDSSFFPGVGAVNPSLNTIAIVLRGGGDHLLVRLG